MRKLLSKHVNNTMESDSNSDRLLQQLQRNATIDFAAKVSNPMEECCLHWTTYSNLNCWFDNWENFLVNYGFGTHQKDGTVHVPEHQKAQILNLDESCLSMDGNTQQSGGCPSVTFYDGLLPVLGMIVSKMSQSST